MRRLQPDWGPAEIKAYNLRNDGKEVTIFEDAQNFRIRLTRQMVDSIVAQYPPGKRLRMAEPGCSSGDIVGFYSEEHDTWGCDIVPAAVEVTRERWPEMTVIRTMAEDLSEPAECDILVLCEFLEHIHDPIKFVQEWMPMAKHVVISHPLVRDGYDPEQGHVWAYDNPDFYEWFRLGGHDLVGWTGFYMGYEMILGMGVRA